jgi:hypothetical protein
MSPARARPVRLRLWPEGYSVASLAAVPDLVLDPAGSPAALIVGDNEVTLLAPTQLVTALRSPATAQVDGWRAITIDAEFPLDTVGVMAAVAAAFADVGVPFLTFASRRTDHFLVPERLLGRALTALSHAPLDRFLSQT